MATVLFYDRKHWHTDSFNYKFVSLISIYLKELNAAKKLFAFFWETNITFEYLSLPLLPRLLLFSEVSD